MHPNAVGNGAHAPSGIVPDEPPNKDQLDDGPGRLVRAVEKTSVIDNTIHGDLTTANNVPCLPIAHPTTTIAHRSKPTASDPQHHQIEAGCVWDRDNWSCSYDTVFMSFWFIYRKSSPGWRDKWRQQAPKWNGFFGEAFNSLLLMVQTKPSREALSRKFTSFRETFRNNLSHINPVYFPRRGQVLTSVCRIFNHIFSRSIEAEPYLKQVVACDWCGSSTPMHYSFSLLGSSGFLEGYHHENDTGPFLPLQTALTRHVQHVSQEPGPGHCKTCYGELRVESLSMPETMWLWIELCDIISPVTPSPRLVFDLQDQRQVYTLQAVIYIGGGHFTAQFLHQSATWWKYDDMWRFGAPCIDHIEDEVDLLKNDDRRAAFLVYCRADCQD